MPSGSSDRLAEEAEADRGHMAAKVLSNVGPYARCSHTKGGWMPPRRRPTIRAAQTATRRWAAYWADTVYAVVSPTRCWPPVMPLAAREAAEVALRTRVPGARSVHQEHQPVGRGRAGLRRSGQPPASWADDDRRSGSGLCTRWSRWIVRAFVAIAQGEPDQAERDAHEALAVAARTQAYLRLPDTLECLARLAADGGNHPHAARLFGAAEAIRQRKGDDPSPDVPSRTTTPRWRRCGRHWGRTILTWRGPKVPPCPPRRRSPTHSAAAANASAPRSGWGSLTPMENDVVASGRGKDWATRTSVRGSSSHRAPCRPISRMSTPSWASTSRVQLVQEAGRRA